jgi:hypothetical protein
MASANLCFEGSTRSGPSAFGKMLSRHRSCLDRQKNLKSSCGAATFCNGCISTGKLTDPAWPESNQADNYLKLRYFIQFGFDKYPKKYPHQK